MTHTAAKGLFTRLVERPDINNKNQFILQTEIFLSISAAGDSELRQNRREARKRASEERRLREAFEFLGIHPDEKRWSRLCEIRHSMRTQSGRQIEKRLVGMRDRILRLKVIMITLGIRKTTLTHFGNSEYAGKRSYLVSDLVRTHITRLMPQKPTGTLIVQKIVSTAVVRDFEASKADVSINSFLHHYWLSKGTKYTTEKKLYKALKKTIRVKDSAKAFLDSFESDSRTYRTILRT